MLNHLFIRYLMFCVWIQMTAAVKAEIGKFFTKLKKEFLLNSCV